MRRRARRDGDARGGRSPNASPDASAGMTKSRRRRTGSSRIAEPLVQLEIDVEDVDQLLADETAPGRVSLLLKNAFNLLAHVGGVALLVVRPLGGDPVELELGVGERDVRIEAGSRSGHKIAGHVVQRN